MVEHYDTAVIPARVRKPKDKPNAEGSVGVLSTWITAALRNEKFFSLQELNQAIRIKLDALTKNLSKRKKAAGIVFSLTKKSHFWHRYLLPPMNWRPGNRPQYNSIIIYPWTIGNTQSLTNI